MDLTYTPPALTDVTFSTILEEIDVIRTLAVCLSAMLLLPFAANAEKALIAQQSVEVKASPKAVWSIVKNYNGLHKWHPAFKDDVIKSNEEVVECSTARTRPVWTTSRRWQRRADEERS